MDRGRCVNGKRKRAIATSLKAVIAHYWSSKLNSLYTKRPISSIFHHDGKVKEQKEGRYEEKSKEHDPGSGAEKSQEAKRQKART